MKKLNTYTFINVTGLAVSLTATILILLWVQDELGYDRFHKNGKDIYQSMVSFNMNGQEMAWKVSSPPIPLAAKEEIPEVVNYCRLHDMSRSLKFEDKETGLILIHLVDTGFFKMFSCTVLEGNKENPLPDKNAVVLSEKIARSLFENIEDAIGKTVFEDGVPYHVSAVMKNIPENSQFKCDAIFSFELFCTLRPELCEHYGALSISNYYQLHPATDYLKVSQQITDIHNKKMPDFEMVYSLQPLFKNHFFDEKNLPNSNYQACRLFAIAVFVLLIIACINYLNLVTARMPKRNKEIFVKQVFGARKIRIFFEAIKESTLMFVVALIIATVFIELLFSLFNEISGKSITFSIFSKITLLVYGVTFIVVIIFAGLYPAITLSLRRPLSWMRGNVSKNRGNLLLRRLLVILQFGASVALIMSSIVITRQMKYIQNKDLGYNKENVIEINLSRGMMKHYHTLQSELLQYPNILGVANATQGLIEGTQGGGWKDSLIMRFLKIDKDFIPTLGMELVAGSNFTGMPSDSISFILNEEAVKLTGIRDPVGKPFEFMGIEGSIIGVVKDFHYDNLHEQIKPLTFFTAGVQPKMYIRLAPNAAKEMPEVIERVCKQYNEGVELHYVFLSDMLNKTYKDDVRTNRLLNIFALIAIFVSCLGLFGLITYIAQTKTKEIGIRKVHGATIKDMVLMLTKEFMILVGISMLIAFPLTYFWLNNMLQEYAYHISIEWWMYVLAALTTVVLTLLTVGFQALKAAMANPVKAIAK